MRQPNIKLRRGVLKYYLTIVATNGEVLMTSQRYFSRGNAMRAARRLSQETGFTVLTGGL